MLLAGVLRDSNDLAAASVAPTAPESPRIVRRQKAIALVDENSEILDDEKVALFRQFTHDRDKVETCLAFKNSPLGTRVMRAWATER